MYNCFQLESSRFPPPLYERGLSSKTPLLSFQKTNIGYKTPLIHSLSWDISPGDIWIILGPNGAGKSTLSRVLLNEAHLFDGDIIIGGLPLEKQSLKQRVSWVGVALQQTRPDLPFTVQEVLSQVQHHSDTVEAVLAQYDLSSIADQPITTLSGGQWQRVVLASIAVVDAPLWWLDEPFTWLDPAQHDRLVRILYEDWVSHQRTLVIVAHDLTPLYGSQLYDHAKVLMMKEGQVVYQGLLAEGLNQLETVFDRTFERIAWNGRTIVV